MRFNRLPLVLLFLSGCTAGPRASMFDPVGGPTIQLMPPEVDPFLDTLSIPASPQQLQPPTLPKFGPVSSAARQQMWRAARSLGPSPKSLPTSIPLTGQKKTTADAAGSATSGKHVDAKPTSNLKTDGQFGFVQIMPPPPDDVGASAAAPRESRYFELPPAPEH